jgi:transcriptional regulator of acetoin/glycerol metabolism
MLSTEGIPHERYFTYSFSPIYVEGGKVGGVLNIATETTERILNNRQLNVLRYHKFFIKYTNSM